MRKHSKPQPVGKQSAKARQVAKELWIGIDLGDRWSEVCHLDASAKLQRFRIRTTPAAFRKHFVELSGARVSMETGSHSAWVSQLLGECGLDVTVANAREIRKIHQSDRKNDRADAEILARLLRFDPTLLAPVRHRSAQMQADIAVLRARDVLVHARTMCINAARGLVKAQGERLPQCSSHAFANHVAQSIPPQLEPALSPLVQTVNALSDQIQVYDKQIQILAQTRYPETELLKQVPSVGFLTALAFILTLADKERFSRSRAVGPFLGLVSRQYDSGERRSQLHITKAGNGYLRRLLVGCAHYILGPFGPDCVLRRFGQRLMERGGKNGKKRAIVAVARKLAILLHHLWVTGDVYDPFHNVREVKTAA